MLDDAKISSVLSSIAGKYIQVSRYNSASKKFEHYVGNPEYDNFSDFEYAKGYQIYISGSSDVTLTLTGAVPTAPEPVSLKTGYNLVLCPKTAETAVETALSPLKLGVDYSKVFYYNKSLKQFQEYSLSKKEFTVLKPAVSYYVYSLKDTTWAINNQVTPAITNFIYDGNGGRVKKIVSLRGSAATEAISTFYISSLFETEVRGQTTEVRKHIFAGANRVATVSLRGAEGDEAISYYHPDHLGSSNVVTGADGKQLQHCEYTPFGSFANNRVIARSEATKQSSISHYYTGKELDSSTNLYFYGARYYDPQLARFITADSIVQAPYDPQSLNRYSYCRNNPLIYTDPTGHTFFSAVGSFFSGIGSAVGSMFSAIGGFFSGIFGGSSGSRGGGNSSSGSSSSGSISALPGSSRGGSGLGSSEAAQNSASGNSIKSGESGLGGILWNNLKDTPKYMAQDLRDIFYWPEDHPLEACLFLLVGEVTYGAKLEAPTVYRQGTFENNVTGWPGNKIKGGEWAPGENPLTTPNFAKDYGLPLENSGKPDWIASGRINGRYSVGRAPPSYNNPENTGGKLEVRPNNPDNDVILDWFHMP